jgi:type II secretory pathway component PulC
MPWIKRLIPFIVSTLAGIVIATAILLFFDASLLRYPINQIVAPLPIKDTEKSTANVVQNDYKAIAERNLFRARLQAEIPKPKSEREIEEDALSAILKTMLLKGVMLGARPKDSYAIIDRGGPKGVWTYEIGDVIEKGLTLKEIGKDSIKIEKGDFAAVLKLFSPVAEKVPGPPIASLTGTTPQTTPRKPAQDATNLDLNKEIRREGNITLISKSLAEKLKTNNTSVMSSITVKVSSNGLKVVTVDRGSIAQKVGIMPDDMLQEVNGYRINSSQDLDKVYQTLKNALVFEVRVLRKGKPETLRYEIR